MKTKRPYTMTTRARAAEQTRTRILDATTGLAGERLVTEISLDLVAERAGVSVQTVLRHFGTRAGLLDEARAHAVTTIREERRSPVGDVATAVRVLVDHYELRGDAVLLMLAQEGAEDAMAALTATGKQVHRTWVADTFAPFLAAADDPAELTDLLVVATDVYSWKLLRRDRRLSRARTEQRIRRLIDALLAQLSDPQTPPPANQTVGESR